MFALEHCSNEGDLFAQSSHLTGTSKKSGGFVKSRVCNSVDAKTLLLFRNHHLRSSELYELQLFEKRMTSHK